MSLTVAAAEAASDRPRSGDGTFDFESHYGVSGKSVRGVLTEILDDMASHTGIHDWDRKLIVTPLRLLTTAVRNFVNISSFNLNTLLVYSAVDELFTVGGVSQRYPAMQDPDDIDSHLFFSKTSSENGQRRIRRMQDCASSVHNFTSIRTIRMPMRPSKPAQGRVVYLDEHIPHLEREALLILYTLCIRLQNEDYGFLYAFIERHLSLKSVFKIPYHWQHMSSPELDSSHQRCYRRVTLSFHITYLTLNSHDSRATEKELIDRTILFPLRQETNGKPLTAHSVYMASSSVLLTIALPEESETHEEEIGLLKDPQGLWTVLVVNCPLYLAGDQMPSAQQTPIAQYVRGITLSLRTQRINAESVYEDLKEQIKACEDESLFDDAQFTKSIAYHWVIRTCDELRESIASSLRFLRRAMDTQINELCRDTHPVGKIGVDFWRHQLEEEIYSLEELQAQVLALNAQVQESRNALTRITAVLEARIALQQGDRIKILAYLATLYLPLTASSSLYSMSVLPKDATFPSFFVVLAILFLSTLFVGLYLSTILGVVIPHLLGSAIHVLLRLRHSVHLAAHGYSTMLKPIKDPEEIYDFPPKPKEWRFEFWNLYAVYIFFWRLARKWPADLVHYVLIKELLFLKDWYVDWSYIGSLKAGMRWPPLWIVITLVRIGLIPVWGVFILVILGILLLEDAISTFIGAVWTLLCCGRL